MGSITTQFQQFPTNTFSYDVTALQKISLQDIVLIFVENTSQFSRKDYAEQ